MPSDPIHTGWTNVEDDGTAAESIVPVRISSNVQPSVAVHEASNQPNPRAMRLSAITGIALVLVGIAFYVGIDNLRGSLTDTGGGITTVTITADGHFDPASVSLAAGSTLTIENKNENPQVIKVKEGSELFGSQVIFDQPFTFVIPANVTGSFTYFSETLPDDQTLVITVAPAIEAATAPTENALPPAETSPPEMNQIPMPFGSGPITPLSPTPTPPPTGDGLPAPELSVAPSALQENVPPVSTDSANGTEIISVGSGAPSSEPATFDQSGIPTNPYTVASGKGKNDSRAIAAAQKNLHSGAPLLAMQSRRPRSNASTGPTVWLALLPAMLGMVLVYRKVFAL